MTKRLIAGVLLGMFAFANIGCATVFASKRKTVQFTTEPTGANILVDGNRVGSTPFQMELENGKDYTVTFRMVDRQDVTCLIGNKVGAGWVVLDVLFGVFGVVIDAVTGDWSALDKNICTATLAPADRP